MSLKTGTGTRYLGVTALKLTIPLDKTDVDILSALQDARKKLTTTHLSEQLKLPERTIRYRLKRLRDKGLLKPPKIQTYERKLGLGERLLLLQSVPEMEDKLIQVLELKSLFYFYGRTYGKYDGFVAHTMYPLVAPQIVLQLAEDMRSLGLIQDFYIFDLVDYCSKGVDVKPVLQDSPWTWDVWTKETKKILKKGCDFDLGLEQFPKVVNFDLKDIQIMKQIVENPKSTLKEVAKSLEQDTSLTQVHKRMKRLQEKGIIRGVKSTFSPYNETIGISCFFKSSEHAKEILCGFHELPFNVTFTLENPTHYDVWVTLPPSQSNEFLQRINIFREYTEEFFVQVILRGKGLSYGHILEAYNQETNSWEIPFADILAQVRQIAK